MYLYIYIYTFVFDSIKTTAIREREERDRYIYVYVLPSCDLYAPRGRTAGTFTWSPAWSFVGRGHDWRSLCPLLYILYIILYYKSRHHQCEVFRLFRRFTHTHTIFHTIFLAKLCRTQFFHTTLSHTTLHKNLSRFSILHHLLCPFCFLRAASTTFLIIGRNLFVGFIRSFNCPFPVGGFLK